MALHVTATVVLPKEVIAALAVSEDKDIAARQVADFLTANLPAEVTGLLTVDVRDSKKNGATKKGFDGTFGSYAAPTN